MKKLIVSAFAASALLLTQAVFAADAPGKEVTLKGEGKCAKCALKESDKCADVIQVEKEGKKVTYYIAKNDASKDFHSKVCQDTVKLTAVGKVEEKDGKHWLVASKLTVQKD